jgi:ABC-type multidrug transport system ATPase subunit
VSQPLIVADDLRLKPGGRSLSLSLLPGEAYAVVGPASGGASQIFEVLTGMARPATGRVQISGRGVRCGGLKTTRRSTPLSLAKALAGKSDGSRVAEALSALQLWEVRKTPWVQLAPESQDACELLSVLVPECDWAAIDRTLDCLDPWALDSTWDLLSRRLKEGMGLIVLTNRLDIAGSLGRLIVVSNLSPVFAGTCEEARERHGPSELLVETKDSSTIKSMVEPMAVSVKVVRGGLIVSAGKGQETAAKLLTEGYGSVRSVVLKEPTLEEAVLSLAGQ